MKIGPISTMLVKIIVVLLSVIVVLTSHISCAFVLHQAKLRSTTPNLQALSSSAEGVESDVSIIWQMKRDECDEWLDQALIERPSEAPTIFSVAASVVESYMLNSTNNSRSLLRRIPYSENDSDIGTNTEDEQIEVLFGAYSNKDKDAGSVSSAMRTRTSKKNRKRTNLKITVAYQGLGFCGWEDQRHELYRNNNNSSTNVNDKDKVDQPLPSVQGKLADILGPALNSEKNSKPIEIKVAGRTDRGVSAIGQVCRVRTWKEIPDVELFVQNLVNTEAEANDLGLRITNVEEVGPDFHPSFGASSRSYVYLIDLEDAEDVNDSPRITRNLVPRIDRMLRELEGKELDYFAVSHGKVKTETTLCTLYHSQASIVEYIGGDGHKKQALCFELVGNRFLRRMVRLIVGTALREAHRGGGDDSLLRILLSKDRRERSRAAPPDGLMFVRADV